MRKNSGFKQRSTDIGTDLKYGHSILISAQRGKRREVELSFSHKNLLGLVIKTAKKVSAMGSVQKNCEICLKDIFIEECQRTLNQCKYQNNGFKIFQGLPWGLPISSKTEMKYDNIELGDIYNHDFKDRNTDYSLGATNRNDFNTGPIYCTGFQYYFDQGDVCDTHDAMSVYSKSLQITFTKYLRETISKIHVETWNQFAQTQSGSSGNGEPKIFQAKIHGEEEPTKEEIKKVLREMYERKQVPSFTEEDSSGESKFFRTEMNWHEDEEVWHISFYLTAAGSTIF